MLLGSIASWAIILNKWFAFRRVDSENRRFLILFSKAEDLEAIHRKTLKRNGGSLAVILAAALSKIDGFLSKGGDSSVENDGLRLSVIERTLQGAIQDEITHQERHLHVLATIGNTAPFVGLLGTVWGIMGAFEEIGRQGSANIAVVAPGVAEALVNTAAGLFVAIPAAVAYNLYVNQIRKMHVQLDVFSSEVISLVQEKMIETSSPESVR
ncbi:MotA/TolQ/ExbB proton channel family protein [hydrothermal vent metagenome]|uniref:MotA/TolQ/ExbB proton channel family protein n=1 Tax=hydrothermal vent metagenome TaxID=652676 RepID=A0A3B1DTL9_9ZZZZ